MNAYLRWLVWLMLFALATVVLISSLKSADPIGLALVLAILLVQGIRMDRVERARSAA